MIYSCPQKKKDCAVCSLEPICYDSDFFRLEFSSDAVSETVLFETGNLCFEEKDK